MRVRQRHIDFAEESTPPAQGQVSVVFVALDPQGDILKQRTKQLLAIAVARRVRGPDTLEVFTECKDCIALFTRKRAWSCVLSVRERGFGSLQFLQGTFPFRFKSTRNEPVLGVHGAIAPLRALRVVT